MNYRLLVFDWDGTLFDSIGWIVSSLCQAAEDCGIAVPSDAAARSVIGLSIHDAMARLYPGSTPELAARLIQAYRRHYALMPPDTGGLFEGVEAMLAELKQRDYRLAVATGKARAGLDQALRITGAGHFFHATRCADETVSKPNPAMLLQLMDELEASPELTLMVGDSIHDLEMARNAGVRAVGVGCGANEMSELAALNPVACLETTVELLRLLDSNAVV